MITKRMFIGCMILAALTFWPAGSRCELVDKIVVVVNSEVITQREIDKILEPIYEQYRAMYYGDELVKKLELARDKVMSQLIEDKLVLSEAKRLNVEVDEKDLDAKIAEIAKRFETKEKFDAAIKEQGLTLKALRNRYKEQIMSRRLVDNKIGSRVTISPAEVSAYYDKHMNEYIQPEEIKLRNILVRPKKYADAKGTLDLAKEILRRLREGGDFGALAKEYSEGPGAAEGGVMGYVKRGDLLPDIEAVVFKLKEAEISDIIQTGLGYHIFMVENKKERRIKDLSEVRQEVEEAIYREKVKGKLKGWVENLKKDAYIAFK